MEAKDVLKELRQRHNMTQDQLSEKLAVTRQAVSRWENGESVPNPETLKQLSALFDTSINHLLGDPRKLICQCCGMPLDSDEVISRDLDGSFNEDYCKWCYTDSKFTYDSMEQLLEFLVTHMSNEQFPPEQARTYFNQMLPKLKHWRNNFFEDITKAPERVLLLSMCIANYRSGSMIHQQRAHKHRPCRPISPLPWRIRHGQYNEAYHWQQ